MTREEKLHEALKRVAAFARVAHKQRRELIELSDNAAQEAVRKAVGKWKKRKGF